MNVNEFLTDARDRIVDPEHWTAEAQARDAAGNPVDPGNPDACRWCADGSLRLSRIIHDVPEYVYHDADDMLWTAAVWLYPIGPYRSRIGINDVYGHAAVIRLFDKAIELTR